MRREVVAYSLRSRLLNLGCPDPIRNEFLICVKSKNKLIDINFSNACATFRHKIVSRMFHALLKQDRSSLFAPRTNGLRRLAGQFPPAKTGETVDRVQARTTGLHEISRPFRSPHARNRQPAPLLALRAGRGHALQIPARQIVA